MRHDRRSRPDDAPQPHAAATAERTLRIGELAELTGTTPRTIRYYEEIGLLGGATERTQGKHRCYTEADVERVREIIRLRDLLGLSLEQLSQLLDAESARAHLRREYHRPRRRPSAAASSSESLEHIDTQLELVRGRLRELGELATELEDKQKLVKQRIARKLDDERRRVARPARRLAAGPGSTAGRWRSCRPGTCSPTSARARSRRCCRS